MIEKITFVNLSVVSTWDTSVCLKIYVAINCQFLIVVGQIVHEDMYALLTFVLTLRYVLYMCASMVCVMYYFVIFVYCCITCCVYPLFWIVLLWCVVRYIVYVIYVFIYFAPLARSNGLGWLPEFNNNQWNNQS